MSGTEHGEATRALHDLLMKAPDAQYDAEGTGMWWCTIDGCDGSDHGLADYILAAIRAGKVPEVALKTYDGTTCWACEKCGKTRTGRGCMVCLERDLASALESLRGMREELAKIAAVARDGERHHKPPFDETPCAKRYAEIADRIQAITATSGGVQSNG